MLTAADIWRPYEIPGVPASGPHAPRKAEIVAWGTLFETLLAGGAPGLAYASKAALDADLLHAANVTALVYGDATAANNGMYVKAGTSGFGSWSRIGDLPNGIVTLSVTGGTANAIQVSAPETPQAPGQKLYLLTPTAANTGATTIALNGGAAVAVKNAFGVALAANSLVNGQQVLMAWSVDHYQLLISAQVDASAILAAAQAAQTAAAASASSASASAAALGNQAYQFDTRTQAAAATIPGGINVINTYGLTAAGDGGGGTYIRGISTSYQAFQSADGQYWAKVASSGGTSGGGIGSPSGRVSLTSGLEVHTTDFVGATTVYFTPCNGNQISLYDGTNWVPTTFAELSQATTDTTKSPAAVGASQVYDLFAWNDGGTPRCTRGPAWTNDTTRSAGTALVKVNGVYLNNASITNGPAAQRGRYVGSIRSNSSSTIDLKFGSPAAGGGAAWIGVWNANNRVPAEVRVQDSNGAWTVAAGPAPLDGSSTNRISILHGQDEDAINARLLVRGISIASQSIQFGFGLDSTSSFAASSSQSWSFGVSDAMHIGAFNGYIGVGFHYLQAIETASSTGQTARQVAYGSTTATVWW